MPNRNAMLIVVFIAGLAAPNAAHACRCLTPTSPGQAFTRADAVVLAEVVDMKGDFEAEGGAIATLKVSKAWKTDLPAMLRVETRTTCAFDFHRGQSYLVYLSRSGSSVPYSTTICDGNLPSAEAGPALKWLQANRKPASVSQ